MLPPHSRLDATYCLVPWAHAHFVLHIFRPCIRVIFVAISVPIFVEVFVPMLVAQKPPQKICRTIRAHAVGCGAPHRTQSDLCECCFAVRTRRNTGTLREPVPASPHRRVSASVALSTTSETTTHASASASRVFIMTLSICSGSARTPFFFSMPMSVTLICL